ncbi:hypothetical protein EsDP_00000708 [Epichloe bromicola]|uniref:Complex 1 LYR protein domain-containing protein n=1 Tax=Epichloe bromicola TaxID=79588 RepID=A0ABQ0CFP9_9HYPO
MHRLPFVPARNSRHRIAALSLYRALLRSARKIPLPKDLQTQHPRSAIEHVVRKRFIKNRPLTSFRLVYASMAAGYKFLSLFSKAQDRTSREHSQITSHLRSRPAPPLSPSHNRNPPPPPRPSAQEAFLVNTSKDGSPHYAPAYTLGSKTRALRLCATADGQPFLRLKKPQPRGLSKMVGRRGRLFREKMSRLVEMDEGPRLDAALEDQWDGLMAAQMRREGLPVGDEDAAAGSTPSTASFSWSAQLSRLWWEWQLEKTWRDWVARGEALNRFVEEQRGAVPGKSSSSRGRSTRKVVKPIKEDSEDRPNVGVHPAASFPLLVAIDAQLGGAGAGPTKEVDPFTGPKWNALVQSERARLLRYLARGGANVNGNKA